MLSSVTLIERMEPSVWTLESGLYRLDFTVQGHIIFVFTAQADDSSQSFGRQTKMTLSVIYLVKSHHLKPMYLSSFSNVIVRKITPPVTKSGEVSHLL